MNGDLERAEALLTLHRPDEALASVRSAMAHDPEDPRPHLLAARAHLAAQRWESADAAAQDALSRDPESSHAARLRALALSAAGDHAGARTWAARAVGLAPDDSRAFAVLAQLESIEGRHEDAIRAAEQAVRIDPDDAYAHFALGSALFADGRYLAADQALRHSLSLDPTDPGALAALGETLAERGRPQDAAELLHLAARSDIRDETVHQDMLRYVRGAAWGLATWPLIGLLCVLAAIGAADNAGAERFVLPLVLGTLAAGLYLARRRRLHQFPSEVRRLLNRRSRRRSAFESAGPPGFRPWWWRLVARIPLAVRVLLSWLLWLAWLSLPLGGDVEWEAGDWAIVLAFGAIPLLLTIRWTARRRKATAPHPLYSE